MKEPTYRQALRHGWDLAWQHKDLWAFGLFAMLLGQLGIVELITRVGLSTGSTTLGTGWGTAMYVLNPMHWYEVFSHLRPGADTTVWFIWMLVVLIGIALVLIFLSVVCQGAIVHAAARYTKHPRQLPHEREAWHAGTRHFWPVLTLNIFRKIVLWLSAFLLVWGTVRVTMDPTTMSGLAYLLLFIIVVLVGMILSLLLVYAVAYVVVEDYRVGRSLSAAWRLFAAHWLVSFEVGILLVFINIVFLFVLATGVVYVFFLPLIFSSWLSGMVGGAELLRSGTMFAYIFFLFFAAFFSSLFTVFVTSVWTYLFVKMHQSGLKSRLLHWIGR